MNRYTVALIQMNCDAAPDENLEKAALKIVEAAELGAQVICLPELYRSRYFCQHEDHENFQLAETVPGLSTNRFIPIAKEKKVVIIAPIFEKRAAGLYHNSAVIIDADGSIADIYRKMHIPDDPGFYEKFYFTPGDLGFKSTPTRYGQVGTLICWDQWFPEGARITSLQGADILFYPTAIGWHPNEKESFGREQREAWRTIQRSHAVANGVYVASINRIGREIAHPGEPGIEFWGSSFIADPFGVLLAEASVDQEEILLAEIDRNRIETVRQHWPFLRDRRIDVYHDITKRFLTP